jgi:peptidoglycan/LPS O-acetylase OafA/YrhL
MKIEKIIASPGDNIAADSASIHKQHHGAQLNYRPDIDGLRAVAILFVVVFHAYPAALPGGFVGVDIFFVISGFLISSIIFKELELGSFSFLDFYMRRIRRIFPALILVLSACFIFGWFVLFTEEFKQLGKHIAAGLGFIQNIVLYKEAGYFDTASELKPLMHLWSLGVEEQFYLLFPLILWFAWRFRRNVKTVILLIFTTSFFLNVSGIKTDVVGTFFLPQTRFWELVAGSLLAYLTLFHRAELMGLLNRGMFHQKRSRDFSNAEQHDRMLNNLLSITGFLLLFLSATVINKDRVFPGWWPLLPVSSAILIILAGPYTWLNKRILSNRLMMGVGLISYPLYLWHWPLLSFAHIVESHLPSSGIRASAVALSLLFAWLTYKYIESPVRFGKNTGLTTAILCSLAILVGFAGFNTWKRNGLDFRTVTKVTGINRFDTPYRQSCQSLTGAEKFKDDDWCNVGNGVTDPDFVVIGDSVSNAYSPMFSAFLSVSNSALKFKQYAKGACPSLINYGPAFCREITDKEVDYIKDTPSIKTVVLAANWPDYFNGKSWDNYKETNDSLKQAFIESIRLYQSLGKTVIVLFAPPKGANPKSCVSRSSKLEEHKTSCDLTLEMAKNNDGNYREWMTPTISNIAIQYFDPFAYLCDSQKCRVIDGEKILYADVTHMSVFGGQYLANKGKNELLQLLSATNDVKAY